MTFAFTDVSLNEEIINRVDSYCAQNFLAPRSETVDFISNKIKQQYFSHLAYRVGKSIDSANLSDVDLYNYCTEHYSCALSFDEYTYLWLLNAFVEYYIKVCTSNIMSCDISCIRNNLYMDSLVAVVYLFYHYASQSVLFENLKQSARMHAVEDADIDFPEQDIFTMHRVVTSVDYTDNTEVGFITPYLYNAAMYKAAHDKLEDITRGILE